MKMNTQLKTIIFNLQKACLGNEKEKTDYVSGLTSSEHVVARARSFGYLHAYHIIS